MENIWLQAVKRIHAIAETGREFSHNEYDLERYQDISTLAQQLLASLANTPLTAIENLFRPDVDDGGYITPKIDVRGVVFKDKRVLLVKEKIDGLWSLPGGYADLGLSAAENTEKEVFEEAGIIVKASHLYAVRHKAKGEYTPDIRDFYKLFFLCEALPEQEIKAGMETADVGYFSIDDLPPLSKGRVIATDIHHAWEFVCNPDRPTLFD
ncbi:ADP-ribose pyrophosphatase [Methylophaga thalassica]|uniref:ADP-ribose pyrophosphatase n=1 Tax=Methylophaga thalassica TaxID=40223 RepID=A0ABQ5TV71_9GAMM|nr:NUDIX hydrolase [Methylophaga thalassica]GLP99327.1 ADP-ribose pyrophosphatase [Methylophaga thalassica]